MSLLTQSLGVPIVVANFGLDLSLARYDLDVRVIVDDATTFDNGRPHDAVADNDIDSRESIEQQTI